MTESARTELSVVDRVAMAIASSIDDGRFYTSPSFQSAARAAIRAMRVNLGGTDELHIDEAEEVWRKGIDAALIWPAGSADRAGVPRAED